MSRINKKVVLNKEFIDENEAKYPNLDLREVMNIISETEDKVTLNTGIEVLIKDIIEINLSLKYMATAYLINSCLSWGNQDDNEEIAGHIDIAKKILDVFLGNITYFGFKKDFSDIKYKMGMSEFADGQMSMYKEFRVLLIQLTLSEDLMDIYNRDIEIYDYHSTMEYLNEL